MSERLEGTWATATWSALAVARPRTMKLIRQGVAFLVVGGVGMVVDVVLFNILLAGPFSPERIALGSVYAKAVSVSAAIAVNWIGNRTWAFRGERRVGSTRAVAVEGVRFAVASVLGSCASLFCLTVSHYALGLRSTLDDNLSANVIGLGVGTVLRFGLYRLWVFRRRAPDEAGPVAVLER